MAAYQQGWFTSGGGRMAAKRGRTGAIARASRARVPPPVDLTDDELADGDQPGKAMRAQYETIDPAELEKARRPFVAIAFEEDAPPTPAIGKGDPNAPGKTSAGSPKIAARPSDSTKAVSSSKNEAGPVSTRNDAGASSATKSDAGPFPEWFLTDRKEIDKLIDEGNYVDAQEQLSRWYWQKPAERDQLLPNLNKMAKALYFSPQPHYYDAYVVKPGDQLRNVGQRYKLSWEYLARLNQVEARKIRMGQKLKVIPGPFGAIVFLNRYELVVHLNGCFVKSYRVGVGKDGTSPVGTFTVKNKMVDPTYYGPDGVIAHDDPKNPLGERWIDIGDGFGIHGTIEPESIGKNESRGCIRMLNSEVEEVYDFLVIGSEVKLLK